MNLTSTPLPTPPGSLIRIDCEQLDATNVAEFKEQIEAHLADQPRLILDMSQLKFVDSSGLGALLSCLRAMNNKDGSLQLTGLSKPVQALFELVRMHRIFSIHPTVEDALRAD